MDINGFLRSVYDLTARMIRGGGGAVILPETEIARPEPPIRDTNPLQNTYRRPIPINNLNFVRPPNPTMSREPTENMEEKRERERQERLEEKRKREKQERLEENAREREFVRLQMEDAQTRRDVAQMVLEDTINEQQEKSARNKKKIEKNRDFFIQKHT